MDDRDPSPQPPSPAEVPSEMVAEPPPDTKPSKFRFKSKHSDSSKTLRSHRRREDDFPPSDSSTRRSHSHHHPRRHHHRKRRRSRSPTPITAPGQEDQGPPALDREAAFRESLFDAMADDEGAAYWESVYGQPIHIYASAREAGVKHADGTLERMTDDEYAAYVRRRMWEKTHAGLVEERARRARERAERERREEEAARVGAEMERRLRWGEERRARRARRERWDAYVAAWAAWDGGVESVPWPVRSGDRRDVAKGDEVRAFFIGGLDLEDLGEKEFAAKLKEERVRWHPDKMQQRFGGQVDEAVMRDVTAIFQVIDKLWADTRPKS